MKKLYSIFLIGLALYSCSDSVPQVTETNLTAETCVNRPTDEAIAIAQNHMEGRNHMSRATISIENIVALGSQNSRAGEDTLLYIVNFADKA